MTSIRLLPLLAAALFAVAPRPAAATTLTDIRHIIVIYTENRSFDNLYGLFPGADGLSAAGSAAIQVDKAGKPFATLPAVMDTMKKPPIVDPRFPKSLPNKPFDIAPYVPIDQKTGDLVHRYYEEQLQIDGGRMDKFAAVSNAGGLTMGYYDGHGMQLWQWAQQYTLADHFFHAAFGGSFLNHFWLVCACTPVFPHAPDALVAKLDAKGQVANLKQAAVTPDFYAVNTLQPFYPPYSTEKGMGDDKMRLPPQTLPTIADRLDAAHVSWAWYAGGWNDAAAGRADKLFEFHHQPFVYFKPFAPGGSERKAHLKDYQDLLAGIAAGKLPHVVFYKPIGELDQHPGYSEVMAADAHVADLLARIKASPLWVHSVVIVTADENGGTWDHVGPPVVDRWGPGTRVPTLIVSPVARQGYVDHTIYDTTSILKLIETRYGLKPLGSRDAAAGDLRAALTLAQ
jgi:phospholipase C